MHLNKSNSKTKTSQQTFEVDIKTAEQQFNSLQCLTEGLVVVVDVLFWSFTEWQGKIGIRLLPIMIRPNRVHPQDDFFLVLILNHNLKL